MSACIELRNVSVELRHSSILQDVGVAFPRGKVTVVTGKTGSGKSVLLKTAAGLMLPDRGEVLFEGRDIALMGHGEEMAFRRQSAFCFQDAALWANQSIFSNIELPLALHESGLSKEEREARIQAVAAKVGYAQSLDFRPASLSVGEQKLISLARALVLDPELLFLDEPASYLDGEAADNLFGILRELKERGKTLVVVSHDPRLIAELGDELCLVSAGKLVAAGPVATVAPLVGADFARRIKQARGHMISKDSLEQML